MFEKTIKKIEAFRGRLLSLEQHDVQLEDGTQAYREFVRHPGAIGVLACLPDGRLVFVRQYRMGSSRVMTEVVAGLLDPGEAPEAAARRELEEETGYAADTLEWIGTIFASPGYVDEKVELYFARLKPDQSHRRLDHGERIDVLLMTRDEFSHAVRSGEIHDAKTLAAWALFLEREKAGPVRSDL